MKKAFVTVVTRSYSKLFETMLHSYINTNVERPDWYIFTDDTVKEHVFNRWKKLYNGNMYLRVPDKSKYAHYKKINPKFYIFELFSLTAYDKIVGLDADLLIMQDIQGLFEIHCNIGMHKEELRDCYNSGVMIVGKKLLTIGTTDELLKMDIHAGMDKYYGNDQRLLNVHFEGSISAIGLQYNGFSNVAWQYPQKDLKIIHYFVKPYDEEYVRRTRESIRGYYHKIFNEKVKGCTF